MVRFLCGTPRGVPLLLYGLMSYEILHASAQDCSGGPGPTAQADAENAVMNNDATALQTALAVDCANPNIPMGAGMHAG